MIHCENCIWRDSVYFLNLHDFPSCISSGVLYVVWNNINKPVVTRDGDSDISTYVARRVRHHYSVDCAHANRGLFMGILILVLTIISLILFFVLINNEAYKSLAIMEANIIELSVYRWAVRSSLLSESNIYGRNESYARVQEHEKIFKNT